MATAERKQTGHYEGPSGVRKEFIVENPSTEYRSPLGQYLRKPSLMDPSKLMYRKVSDDPMDTAGREMTILDCAVEDYDRALENSDADALRSFRSTKGDADKAEFGGVTAGEPLVF